MSLLEHQIKMFTAESHVIISPLVQKYQKREKNLSCAYT